MREHLAEIRAKYGLPPETEKPPLTLEDVDARIGQWLEQEREFNREVMAHALARLMDDAENGLVGKIGPRGEKGDQGPPGKLPLVKVWKEHQISYSGDVVAHDGSTFQAIRDTARVPGEGDDWIVLARGGRDGAMPHVCGTYDSDAKYRLLDVIALNGSTFIARRDSPGPCPGDDWQLFASAGRSGGRGEKGDQGPCGMPGERGPKGEPGLSIVEWEIDAPNYAAFPIMSNGRKGPPLELLEIFKRFVTEAR
jgi:hypothetical protein